MFECLHIKCRKAFIFWGVLTKRQTVCIMRLESKEKRVTKMKLLTKIRKADPIRKTEIWQSLNLSNDERDQLIRDMVLSLPKGAYKIHDRQYGTNLVDKIYEIYGWMPSMLVSESTMLGLQALYPNRVYASFTLGLDAIEIK